jgi:hypothetical protein
MSIYTVADAYRDLESLLTDCNWPWGELEAGPGISFEATQTPLGDRLWGIIHSS